MGNLLHDLQPSFVLEAWLYYCHNRLLYQVGRSNAYIQQHRTKDALFFFNYVISQFGVPQVIVTDHGSHFRNHMMNELTAKLGLSHDSSTPYYPQSNGKFGVINKILKQILQQMIGVHK